MENGQSADEAVIVGDDVIVESGMRLYRLQTLTLSCNRLRELPEAFGGVRLSVSLL